MAEAKAKAKASALQPGNARGVNAASNPAHAKQDKTLGLHLIPVKNNSDQAVVANISSIHLAPGMAYINFGFVEPGVLAALRQVQPGGKLPDEISSKLAVRVLVGFDGLANLQQRSARAMRDLAKAAKQLPEQRANN